MYLYCMIYSLLNLLAESLLKSTTFIGETHILSWSSLQYNTCTGATVPPELVFSAT